MPEKPSPTWQRLSNAAPQVGISPHLLQREIEAQRAKIRTARFGSRGILHVHADDVAEYAARLQQLRGAQS